MMTCDVRGLWAVRYCDRTERREHMPETPKVNACQRNKSFLRRRGPRLHKWQAPQLPLALFGQAIAASAVSGRAMPVDRYDEACEKTPSS
jgi:hypothetical protein